MRNFFLIISFLFPLKLLSLEISAQYEISYGIFKKLGVAEATLQIDEDGNYKSTLIARATGLARILSNGLTEYYSSEGIVENDIFIPKKFIRHTQRAHRERKTIHYFDHQNKIIRTSTFDQKEVTKFDTSFRPSKEIERSHQESTLPYYAKNDILSLFLNLNHVIKEFQPDKRYTLHAIGASRSNGEIFIFYPNLEFEKKHFDSLETLNLIVTINRDIFSSEKGELLISINEHGFCSKAVLKNVLFFGDIVGRMISFNELHD